MAEPVSGRADRIVFTDQSGREHDVTNAVEFDLKPGIAPLLAGAADQIAAERKQPLTPPGTISLAITVDPDAAARLRHQLAKPRLWRQPTPLERPMHKLHPGNRERALQMLDQAVIEYRYTMQHLPDDQRGMVMRLGWQARAELYRRIAARERIID